MGIAATVKYLKVHNPDTGVDISLIPWFMLPGRRHPVFVYAYAIWYYHINGKKSLKETAIVTGKLFKIKSLNKSTVSRNIKCMENFIDVTSIDRSLAVTEQDELVGQATAAESNSAQIKRVSEILADCPSTEALVKACDITVKKLPDPINPKATVNTVLCEIPDAHSNVIKRGVSAGRKFHDLRKRPPRPRNIGTKRMQRSPEFIDHHHREAIRKEFIVICKHLVLDAAVTYHRFLV
jgi:hypothetical protein